jgi:hypothetical protein
MKKIGIKQEDKVVKKERGRRRYKSSEIRTEMKTMQNRTNYKSENANTYI